MLLDALPSQERERLLSEAERVQLEVGQTLHWPDEPIRHVYFPIDAIACILSHGEGGESVETGLIGREGVAGLPVFLGAESSPQKVVAQVPGESWRMSAAGFRQAALDSPRLHELLLRFTQALLVMSGQGVLCNRLHPIDERLARWLLLIHDRVGRDTFQLTHEFIAIMLGVRRASVTVALGSLQRAGTVGYQRGEMTVLDRQGLEAASCPCYAVIKRQFGQLLGRLSEGSASR